MVLDGHGTTNGQVHSDPESLKGPPAVFDRPRGGNDEISRCHEMLANSSSRL